jgi:uncharacterized damage-inducible protein DinB
MTDAPAPRDALSFQELMAYTGEETDRWEAWLRARDPAVLDVTLGEGRWGTVRELLFHTFLVERRYADRLLGDPVTPYEGVPHDTVDELFAIHRAARERMARYVAGVSTAAEWDEVLTFETLLYGPMYGSRRKIVAHALLHGVRHWAQVATALRQAGHEQWPHDLLAASAIT